MSRKPLSSKEEKARAVLLFSIRKCDLYFDWKNRIYNRDKSKDQITGEHTNGHGNVHHRIPFWRIIDHYKITSLGKALRCRAMWNVDNGVLMSKDTHNLYHEIYGDTCETIAQAKQNEEELKLLLSQGD